MKFTGASLPASIITWFRMPKEQRHLTLTAVFASMLVFLIGFAVIGGIAWLIGRAAGP